MSRGHRPNLHPLELGNLGSLQVQVQPDSVSDLEFSNVRDDGFLSEARVSATNQDTNMCFLLGALCWSGSALGRRAHRYFTVDAQNLEREAADSVWLSHIFSFIFYAQ